VFGFAFRVSRSWFHDARENMDPAVRPGTRIVTREEMRAIDRWAIETVGIPSIVLMENAGRGVAEAVLERLRGRADAGVLVVCGPGNNGGDGFVAARHLANAGRRVALALAGAEADFDRPGDAGTNARVARAMGLPFRLLDGGGALRDLAGEAEVVLDALFGTGLTRPVEGFCREVIEAINASGREVVAVDIPSGLDADAGRPLGAAVRAAATVTMAFPKAGFFAADGPAHCGDVRIADIGIPRGVPAWDGRRLRI
jgi:NAD(P)H-hydrate epimerase